MGVFHVRYRFFYGVRVWGCPVKEHDAYVLVRLKHDLQLCLERLKNPLPGDDDALRSRLRLAIMNLKMYIKTLEERLSHNE